MQNIARIPKKNKKELGQSLVELALSMVFLGLLLGVVVDAGIAFFNWVSLRDAAQEGAIYASTHPTDVTGIELRARNAATDPILQDLVNTDVDVLLTGSACRGITGSAANGVTVKITYKYYFITPFFRPAGWDSVTISAEVTNTILNPPC